MSPGVRGSVIAVVGVRSPCGDVPGADVTIPASTMCRPSIATSSVPRLCMAGIANLEIMRPGLLLERSEFG
jgi:hypothetical protein